MTTITHTTNPFSQAQLKQLVLFPELLGMASVSLDQCKCQQCPSVQTEEQSTRKLSLLEALAAGQMLLW